MEKYIDADKLIVNLERQNVHKKVIEPVIRIINSLQREQLDVKSYIEGLLKECDGKDGEYYRGRRETLAHLFAYLGGSPLKYMLQPVKQPEVDLEKELVQWRHKHFKGKRDSRYFGEYLTRESQLELAHHFAAWQKNKMMKVAVDGEVEEVLTFREPSQFLAVSAPCPEGFKDGEKVKVIIVKED